MEYSDLLDAEKGQVRKDIEELSDVVLQADKLHRSKSEQPKVPPAMREVLTRSIETITAIQARLQVKIIEIES